MWNQSKENIQNNETVSLRSLQNLIIKLQKSPGLLETFDNIISNQLKEGMVEKLDKSIPLNIPDLTYLINLFSEKMLRAQKSVLFMMRLQEQIIGQNR